MKFCVNCTHYVCTSVSKVGVVLDCERQCNIGPELIDPVTGQKRIRFCSVERGAMGDCGPEATLYGPKEA